MHTQAINKSNIIFFLLTAARLAAALHLSFQIVQSLAATDREAQFSNTASVEQNTIIVRHAYPGNNLKGNASRTFETEFS